MKCPYRRLLVILSLVAVLAGAASGQEEGVDRIFRTWTDNTGQFTVRAKLVSAPKAEAVRLEREDGEIIEVPRARLSEGDLDYLRAIQPEIEIDYSIINVEIVGREKRSVDVRMGERISERELRAIAYKIRNDDETQYERTFILYYLPDMEVGAGAWATSHFVSSSTPEVRILGLSDEEAETLRSRPRTRGRIIGTWMVERPGLSYRLIIVRRQREYFFEKQFPDGSSGSTAVSASRDGKRFEEGNSAAGEFYLINDDGDLEAWDREGRIFVARSIDD